MGKSTVNKVIVETISEAFNINTDFGKIRLTQIVERSKSDTILNGLLTFLPEGVTQEEVISKIEEALATVKRQWTELYPAVNINPSAILRNKIINFIGSKDKCRCTREEYNDFCNSLQEDEEIGKRPSKSWLTDNKHLVKNIKIGNTPYLKLTEVGKRVYSFLNSVNESIDLNLPVKWNKLDDYRENERIGGIEFRPPVFNDTSAPPAAVDNPVGEASSILSKEEEKQFLDWIEDGNASKIDDNTWLEQTTQWRKKFSYDELKQFFKKEYLNESVDTPKMNGNEAPLTLDEEEMEEMETHNQLVDPVMLDQTLNNHFGVGEYDFSFVIDRFLVKVQSNNYQTPPDEMALPDGAILKKLSHSDDLNVTTYLIQKSVDEALSDSQIQRRRDDNYGVWKQAKGYMGKMLTHTWLTDSMYDKFKKLVDEWSKLEFDLEKMPIMEAAIEESYFKSLGDALDAAVDRAERKGYTVDTDSLFFHLGTGGISYETSKSASIPLEKNGKPQNKMLQISVYRMPSGKYELTTYIN